MYSGSRESCEESDLVGCTFCLVERDDSGIVFYIDEDYPAFELAHDQCCCEHVYIEDIDGELTDLENTPILSAEIVDNGDMPPPDDGEYDSCTWTFVKLATVKGYVTVRFFGFSNGYYSESASFYKITR